MRQGNQSFAFGKKKYTNVYTQNKTMIKPSIFYSIFFILLSTNILTLIVLFLTPDIKTLLNDTNNEVFISYENKISELRAEVDLLYSRQYAQNGNINLQIQELTQQQAALFELQPFIKELANQAVSLGVDNVISSVNNKAKASVDNFTTGSILKSTQNKSKNDNLSHILTIKNSISQMTNDSYFALAAISNSTNKTTSKILYELRSVGIVPKMPQVNKSSVGGPFLAANTSDISTLQSNLLNEANDVSNALNRFAAAKKAVKMSPLYVPLNHGYRISSPYGGRKDPILGKRAFHSGTDMAMAWGSPVMSSGDGVVVFVGRKGAYGKTVEIMLDGGLLTRFAHLSSYSVKKGQRIKAGSIVAKVGSTGRSTGPHLHFEIRNGNDTLNSTDFIKVSKRLKKFM